MNAMAKEFPESDTNMEETVVYQLKDRPGNRPDRPTESQDMAHEYPPSPNPNQSPQGRYAFGSGSRPLEGYTIKRAIGRGGFGEVYYAMSDSGKEVALKVILRNLDVERRGVTQCMNLKCPNLLTIYDLRNSEGGDTFVIMEYVSGPSLANVLKQHPGGLPPDEVRRWLKGLIDGVSYLHDHGIVHRDLKPANLFMEEGIVKIGDYGLAKLITTSQGSDHSESIGTCHYMAPEIGSGKYHKPIDIYAIGIILYEMLTGRVPFEGETVNEVLMKHLTSRPDVSALPDPFRAIVARALAKDPNHRQRNIVELLPLEDAPRTPEIRIIGDGKAKNQNNPWGWANLVQPFLDRASHFQRGRGGAQPVEANRDGQADEAIAIKDEEPIFYIGPDTVPPRRQPSVQERLQARWQALNRPIGRGRRHGGQLRPAGDDPREVRSAFYSPADIERERRIPDPPPMPTPRLRFAELTTSMLLAAPLTALLTIPAAAVLDIDISSHPQQVALLFGMGLIGSWAVLMVNKWTEFQPSGKTKRLWAPLATGMSVAITTLWLMRLLAAPYPTDIMVKAGYGLRPESFSFLAFFASFAVLFTVPKGWVGLTCRDRPRRFRLRPVIYTALLAMLLYPLWPFQRADEVAAATILAVVVQLVSPWSEEAAAYSRYVRTLNRRRGKKSFAA